LVAQEVLIKDAKNMRSHINVSGTIKKKYEPRSVSNGRKTVCEAVLSDSSGEIHLALWQKDVGRVSVGDRIYIENGYTEEYLGTICLSRGFWGKLVVLNAKKPAPIWPPGFVHGTQEATTAFEQPILSGDDIFEKAKTEREFFRQSLS